MVTNDSFSDSNVGGPALRSKVPPPPPPPPPGSQGQPGWRQKQQQQQEKEWRTPSGQAEEKTSRKSPGVVLVNGSYVPEALAGAFKNPRKDKRPFTYFTSGAAPNLSEKPSPSFVRKANPATGSPSIPKVLPIVSEEDLEAEEARNMPFAHLQYNTPINLYSKSNVDEAFHQQTGGPIQGGKFHIEDSATYKLIHEIDEENRQHHQPHHQHRHNEIGHQQDVDHPHYQGFVNPYSQSPSFKKLQLVTTGNVADDEAATPGRADVYDPAVEQHGQQHIPHWAMKDPTTTEGEERDGYMDPLFAAQIAEAERPKVPPQHVPIWAQKAAEKHGHWDRSVGIDPDQQPRREFKPVEPSWTNRAERSHHKWEGHYHHQPPVSYQQPQPVYQPPQPVSAPQPPLQSYRPTPLTPSQPVYQPQPYQSSTWPGRQSRSRSHEPPEWRTGRQAYGTQTMGRINKEFWLKPYVAPNVDSLAKQHPHSPGPLFDLRGHSSSQEQKSPVPHGVLTFGSYYGPERGAFYQGRQWIHGRSASYTSGRGVRESVPRGGAIYQPHEISGRDFQTVPAPRKEITVASLVSGEAEKPGPVEQVVPAWQKTAEQKRHLFDRVDPAEYQERRIHYEEVPHWAQTAHHKRNLWEAQSTKIDPHANRPPVRPDPLPNWARRADETHSLWHHESQAVKQRSTMERELDRRHHQTVQSQGHAPVTPAAKYSPSAPAAGGSWRREIESHVPSSGGVSSTAVATSAPAQPLWQHAHGASTKSQSSGVYKDPEGHNVSYTREIYTSSDPGKEFSMKTEEEKKVLEEPVQPGVISRHTTTKYYKRSTFNSTSTTGTSQAPPSITFSRMPPSLEAPKPGPVGQGITQF